MFGLDITAEKLFTDPQMLTFYLEGLSSEIERPYIDRRGILEQSEMQSEIKEVIDEVQKRETQMKLLIDFITMLMDKSEEKMFIQNERIEKQDLEILQLKEENITRKTEAQGLQEMYRELAENYKQLEALMAETEQNHESEKRLMAEAHTKIQSLDEIRDKYEDLKEEKRESSKVLDKLNEEKDQIQTQLATLKDENSHLKEELEFSVHKAEQFDSLNKEYIKLELKYEKALKELESERLEFTTKKNSFQAELMAKQEKMDKLQEDFRKLRKLTIQRPGHGPDSPDDIKENLNVRLSDISAFSQQRRRKSLTGDNSSEGGSDNLGESSNLGLFESSQYDNMRINLSLKDKSRPASDNIITKDTKAVEGGSPTMKRKDIFEEFFLLSFQSALINSPHFDELAGIDTRGLYEEVLRKNIPFHKWYHWLEKKLDEAYKNEILPEMMKFVNAKEQKSKGAAKLI